MDFRGIFLSERSQPEKLTYSRVSVMRHSVHVDRVIETEKAQRLPGEGEGSSMGGGVRVAKLVRVTAVGMINYMYNVHICLIGDRVYE